VNLRAPNDKAAARVDEVEECPLDWALRDDVGEWEEEEREEEEPFGDWRLSWRAFASAFSWVRTKLARFLTKSCPSSEWSFSMVVTFNPYYEQTRQATALDNAEGEAIQGVFKGR
jgi:hypothetical protein